MKIMMFCWDKIHYKHFYMVFAHAKKSKNKNENRFELRIIFIILICISLLFFSNKYTLSKYRKRKIVQKQYTLPCNFYAPKLFKIMYISYSFVTISILFLDTWWIVLIMNNLSFSWNRNLCSTNNSWFEIITMQNKTSETNLYDFISHPKL